MEETYHVEGTLADITQVLQKEFGLSPDVADQCSVILAKEQPQQPEQEPGQDPFDAGKDASTLCLNKSEHFSTPVFNTRFSVCFTEAKLAFLTGLVSPLIGFLLSPAPSGGAVDTLVLGGASSVISGCIVALLRSGTHIKDDEYCTYLHALRWKALHPAETYFKVDDILPVLSGGVCDCLDKIRDGKMSCHTCHNELCTEPDLKGRYLCILGQLCVRKVFVQTGDFYQFFL